MRNTSQLITNQKQKKYIKPQFKKSKIDLNLFYMDLYGILSDEATVLLACSAPPSQCVG